MNFRKEEYKLINNDNGTSITLNDISPGGVFYSPPRNYEDSETTIARNMDNFGMMTMISRDFEFVQEGADFLRAAYNSRDIEADVDCIVYRFNPNTDVRYTFLTGKFDFSTISNNETFVSISFRSGGLNALIKSKEDEEYELERVESIDGSPITPVEKQDIALVSRDILLISELETTEQDSLVESFRMNFGGGNYREGHVGVPCTINYESDDMVTNQINNQFTGSLTEGLASMVFYLNNDIKKDLEVTIDLTFTGIYRTVSDLSSDAFFKVIIDTYENGLDLDIVNSKRRTLFEVLGDANVVDYFFEETTTTLSFSETITLEVGESLSLQWYGAAEFGGTFDSGRYDVDFRDVSCKINIDENSQRPNSISKMVLMKDVGNQIMKILTGKEGKYESDFFTNGDFKLCGVSLGLWIRQFFDRNISISFKQFVENSNALFLTGYTIDRNNLGDEFLIHEEMSYFFQNFIAVDLTEQVSNVVRNPFIEQTFTNTKMGYKKPSGDNLYEEAQGLDEPNILNKYTFPITRVDETYDKSSDFRADSYGKAFAMRKSIETNPTDDTRYDKTTFVLDAKETEGENLTERTWEDDFEQLPTGVYSPETITGLRLSPINNLLRHGKFIRSFLSKFVQDSVRFSNSNGNELLTTQPIGGVERAENSDILISDLDYPLFVNQTIEFVAKVDFDINQQLFGRTQIGDRSVQNFFGSVRFINEFGQKEEGFILEVSPNNEGKWKLLKKA